MSEAFIAIDGVALPTPTVCPITEYDFDAASTGRTESGYMHRDRVRAKVMELEPEWENLTPEQATRIRTSLLPVTVAVTIQTPLGFITRDMTAGDLHWTPNPDHNGSMRWDLKTKLSEN